MPRIRTIKPEFSQSESVGRLSREARLLFIQLWTLVDDEGRARAAPRYLVGHLYPYDSDAYDLIDGWLDELERGEHIIRYEVDGAKYLEVAKWLEHQRIQRPTPSRLPTCMEASRNTHGVLTEDSRTDLGPRTMDHGPVPRTGTAADATYDPAVPVRSGRNNTNLDDGFEDFWAAYPSTRRVAKGDAKKAYAAVLKQMKATSAELVEGATHYAIYKGATDPTGQYTKHPAAWLRAECWPDRPTIPRQMRARHCENEDDEQERIVTKQDRFSF